MRRAVACCTVYLALTACAGDGADGPSTRAEPTPTKAATFTVSGYLTANGSFGLACRGIGESADLHRGTPVVVRDAGGTKVAAGALGDGFADDDAPQSRCIFSFTVRKVPEGNGPFTVQVARRPPVSFTRDQANLVEVMVG